jgi:replicative DNA helicase
VSQRIDPSLARQFDRLPPHSIEAEMALLGSLLLADGDKGLFAQVRGVVDRDCFYQADHQIVFDVVARMLEQGRAIDGLTVREELGRRQLLEEIGGTSYLGQILHSVPSSAHAVHYARIVREKSMLRQLISLSNDALRAAYAPANDDNAGQLLADFAAKASRASTGGRASEVHRIDVVAREVLARREKEDVLRIPTGIGDLDNVVGGLRKGGKTIVGAKPGMGKSLLVKQIGWNVVRAGVPFGLITVEETRHKVAENLLANASNVPNNRIAFGTAGPEEWDAIDAAVGILDGRPFFVVDAARKLSHIVAMAHVLACQHGCQVIAVDHLHIIDPEAAGRENREQEMSRISAELKWVWKDLNVCGIEAAQLNRKSGRDRPQLDSLRDSGSLEQDGDTIILLHREDYYRRTEGGQPDQVLEAIVAKNKDGATGTVPLFFDEARQSVRCFMEAAAAANGDPTEGMFQ